MYDEIMSKYYKDKDFNTNKSEINPSFQTKLQSKVKQNRSEPRFTETSLRLQYKQTQKEDLELSSQLEYLIIINYLLINY